MGTIDRQDDPIRSGLLKLSLLTVLAAAGVACTAQQERMHLVVSVPTRAMSKTPFVIAADQGLYEKYGLDVELWLGDPELEGGKKTYLRFWESVWMVLGLREPEVDVVTDGHTPRIVRQVGDPQSPQLVSVGATDCSVRYYVIARPGIQSVEDLKGKRLGINSEPSTMGFTGLRLVERMGWKRGQDITLVLHSGMEQLRKGDVEAIIGGDEEWDAAQQEGFPVLEDTRNWNEQLSGNSAIVEAEWLQDPAHREAVRRFMKATAEAVALFHQRPELVSEVLVKWHGMDRATAESRYQRTDYIPRKPYPCVEGIKNTMRLYDSDEMRRHESEDFYDDSFVRELDESGFLDGLYQ